MKTKAILIFYLILFETLFYKDILADSFHCDAALYCRFQGISRDISLAKEEFVMLEDTTNLSNFQKVYSALLYLIACAEQNKECREALKDPNCMVPKYMQKLVDYYAANTEKFKDEEVVKLFEIFKNGAGKMFFNKEDPKKKEVYKIEALVDNLNYAGYFDAVTSYFSQDGSQSPSNYSVKLPFLDKATYRGDLKTYLEHYREFDKITRIDISGEMTANHHSVFIAPYMPDIHELYEFMKIIDKRKIKELSFERCNMNGDLAIVLAAALAKNSSLESLRIVTHEVGDFGMQAILRGLKYNTSLKYLFGVSDNLFEYAWSLDMLIALKELLMVNHTLEFIDLDRNYINTDNPHYIRMLFTPYRNENAHVATVKNLGLGHHRLEFNRHNVLDEALEKYAKLKFEKDAHPGGDEWKYFKAISDD
jgi:hypothetical protein